ncbi:ABC transporter permease [Vreelandella andesensis]|nr:ABC transporter permease [Halomonas andesensis]
MEPNKLTGCRALRSQPWLFALVGWLPPLMTLLFIAVFELGTPQSLPVGVVDLDHTSESRALQRYLDASPALDMRHPYPSAREGSEAFQRAEVLALLIIPQHFGRDLRMSLSPKAVAFYNSQYLLAGKFISSALTQSSMNFAAEAGVVLRLGQGYALPQAVAAAAPVRPQITSLYNSGMSYARFLVTTITPALWQIVIVVATLLTLCWRLEKAPLPDTFSARSYALWQLLMPISLLLWFQGLLMLGLYSYFLGWSPEDSIVWLAVGMALMVLAVQSMATLILSAVANKIRALSLCAAYLAPAFAFMGITFPRGDMNMLARVWGNLMPSTHYIELQVAVADHGAPLATLLPPLLILLLFLLPFPLAIHALPKQLTINPAEQVS